MASLCDVWHALGLCADHHVESQSNRCRYHGTNAAASCPFSRWCSASSVLYDKNVKLKGLALSSTITSIFGITEPTVYGVTLPLKKPFIAVYQWCHRGAFIGFSQVENYTFGLVSLLSLPSFIPQDTKDLSGLIAASIGTAIALAPRLS